MNREDLISEICFAISEYMRCNLYISKRDIKSIIHTKFMRYWNDITEEWCTQDGCSLKQLINSICDKYLNILIEDGQLKRINEYKYKIITNNKMKKTAEEINNRGFVIMIYDNYVRFNKEAITEFTILSDMKTATHTNSYDEAVGLAKIVNAILRRKVAKVYDCNGYTEPMYPVKSR